jgi:hypothetical protein
LIRYLNDVQFLIFFLEYQANMPRQLWSQIGQKNMDG